VGVTVTIAEHAALDGQVVQIESSYNLDLPASSYVLAAQHEFEAGPIKFGREVATDFNIDTFEEAFGLQGGTLYRATRTITDSHGIDTLFSLALWEGNSYSVNTQVAAADPSHEVVELFELFTITETEFGLSLSPRRQAAAFEDSERDGLTMYKLIPEVGTMTIKKKTRAVQRGLPTWSGRSVRGGELYQVEAPSPPDPRRSFTLVGSSAVSMLWPLPAAQEEPVMDFLEQVVCGWGKH
jgi:hypothetical protein